MTSFRAAGLDVIDETANLIFRRNKGAGPDAANGLPHIVVEIRERFQRERRTQAGVGFDAGFPPSSSLKVSMPQSVW